MSFAAASGNTSLRVLAERVDEIRVAPCARSHAAIGHWRFRQASCSGVSPASLANRRGGPRRRRARGRCGDCSGCRARRRRTAPTSSTVSSAGSPSFVPELLRRQTLTKLSTIPRPISTPSRRRPVPVLSPPRPPRVYDRLGRGPRVSRRGAQTLCAPGKWWSSRSPPNWSDIENRHCPARSSLRCCPQHSSARLPAAVRRFRLPIPLVKMNRLTRRR